MPLIFYIIVMVLLQASIRLGTEIPPERRGTIKTFWEDTDTEEITRMDAEEPASDSPAG